MLDDNYEQVREHVLHLSTGAQSAVRSALMLSPEQQQQLLSELKARPPIRARRVDARDFSPEQRWLRENRRFYRGQYLAVCGDRLIAHGTDPKEVVEKARASGKDCLLSRVPPEGEIYGGGLW